MGAIHRLQRDNTEAAPRECALQIARTQQKFTKCRVYGFVPSAERPIRAAALDAACEDTGTSNRQVATMVGVKSATIIRKLRTGEKQLTDDRITMFSPKLREAFDRAMRRPVQLSLPGVR